MKLESLYFPEIGALILFAVLFIEYFYAASVNARRDRDPKTLVSASLWSALQLLNLALLITIFNLRHGQSANVWNASPAPRAFVVLALAETALAAAFLLATARAFVRRREAARTLTNDSVSEAILSLPSSLMFAEADGRIILSNDRLRSQVFRITGKALTDANEAWRCLAEASSGLEPAGAENLLCQIDGRVWNFRRKTLVIGGKDYRQIDGDDVTERVRLMEELKLVNMQKEKQNQRTRRLIADIINAKSEQEILDMQGRVHHEVGQCVIMARQYLSGPPDAGTLGQLLDHWEQVFRFDPAVSGPADASEREQEICTAADLCGCRVLFRGERPRSDSATLLYLSAAREAVTNAIRHAAATEVYIDGQRSKGELIVVITDNSGVQVDGLTEGVGLGVLRRKLEAAGVRLDIDTGNGVRLILSFPGEGNE